MKYLEKHPMIMIAVGIMGIFLSAIFVRYSQAPSVVTAAYRLLWTVALMAPVVFFSKPRRKELFSTDKKTALLCAVSGIFLALHFVLWFESLRHTSVASLTTIVCTEVIWVALGFCLFLGGRLSAKAVLAIVITLAGSMLIAWSDSSLRGKPPLRRLSCAAGSHCGSCLHIDWPGGTDKYLYHYLYLYCVPVFRSCAGAYHPLPGIFSDRLRGQRHCCGAASGHIFHNSGAQYFQLVSEISVPHLCLCLQAVRACSCRPVCRISFWRNSRHSADWQADLSFWAEYFTIPGWTVIPPVQAKESSQARLFFIPILPMWAESWKPPEHRLQELKAVK